MLWFIKPPGFAPTSRPDLHTCALCRQLGRADSKLSVRAMFSRALGVVALAVLSLVSPASAITYSPLKPPSYPLAVRSPYLSGELHCII